MKQSKLKYKRPYTVPNSGPNNKKAFPKMKIKNKSDAFAIVPGEK